MQLRYNVQFVRGSITIQPVFSLTSLGLYLTRKSVVIRTQVSNWIQASQAGDQMWYSKTSLYFSECSKIFCDVLIRTGSRSLCLRYQLLSRMSWSLFDYVRCKKEDLWQNENTEIIPLMPSCPSNTSGQPHKRSTIVIYGAIVLL